MMASDRASILLCHEVDTRAAFALARFAYSLARSLTKFRPVVRTDSISVGGRMVRREPLYAIRLCDRPAMASQCPRSFLRIVKCYFRTTRWSGAGVVDRAQVVGIALSLWCADACSADHSRCSSPSALSEFTFETDREVRGLPLIQCVPAFWRYATRVTAQGVVWNSGLARCLRIHRLMTLLTSEVTSRPLW
jgi:hypothetical protein